jgi:type IV pilus assembly protein PilN
METIHKKNGRLHIYVRQDKYKGELKSHNYVGRTFINGKQKVSSSGTTNLEEAIPILEKWFDDLQLEVKVEENNNEQTVDQPKNTSEINLEQPQEAISTEKETVEEKPKEGLRLSMLDKLKNIKFSKSKDKTSTPDSTSPKKKKINFKKFLKISSNQKLAS